MLFTPQLTGLSAEGVSALTARSTASFGRVKSFQFPPGAALDL